MTYHYIAWKSATGKQKFNGYSGDGTDNRDITGVGFQPYYVILKDVSSAQDTVHHPASLGLAVDNTMYFKASATLDANRIQALQSDGFQVGNDTDSNKNGDCYAYFAWTQSVPTAVRMKTFVATSLEGGGVVLQWKTGHEVRNLGFHLYREEDGERVRLTPELIAGSALMAGNRTPVAGRSYQWWDSTAAGRHGRGGVRYWLEDVDLNGTRTWHGPVVPVVSKCPLPEVQRSKFLRELGERLEEKYRRYWRAQEVRERLSLKWMDVGGPFRRIPFGAGLRDFSGDRSSVLEQPRMRMDEHYTPVQWRLAGGPAVKVLLKKEGWYRLGQPELLAAGLDASVDPRYLQLYVDGREIPILVRGEHDGRFDVRDCVEFYGTGLDTPWADKQAYWLVIGSRPGKRMELLRGAGRGEESSGFLHPVEMKERTFYFPALKNGEADNFFGPVITTEPVDEVMTLQHLLPSPPGEALLEVSLQGVTEGAHRVKVLLNDTEVGQVVWEGQARGKVSLPVAQADLLEGENLVTLVAENGETDVSLIDFIRLTYWHAYTAEGDALRFTAQGGHRVTIDGFSTSRVRVFDITNPKEVREVAGVTRSRKGDYTIITIQVPGAGDKTLLALTEKSVKQPASIIPNRPSSWHTRNHGPIW